MKCPHFSSIIILLYCLFWHLSLRQWRSSVFWSKRYVSLWCRPGQARFHSPLAYIHFFLSSFLVHRNVIFFFFKASFLFSSTQIRTTTYQQSSLEEARFWRPVGNENSPEKVVINNDQSVFVKTTIQLPLNVNCQPFWNYRIYSEKFLRSKSFALFEDLQWTLKILPSKIGSKHCGCGSRSCQSSKILPSKFFMIYRPSAKFLLLNNF